MIRIDAHELATFATDLGHMSARTAVVSFRVFKEAGNDLRDEWRSNARETAGEHGRHYPNSITAEMRPSLNIEVEIGPDPRLPQGGMSFEFGSVKQPPHLDGQRAADTVIPRLERRIDAALSEIGL